MPVAVQPDVAGDLRRIHAVISRALTVSIRHCDPSADSVSAEHAQPAHEGFLAFAEAMAGLLRAHHLVEDEVAFPRVRHLIPEMPYDQLAADHRQVAALVTEMGEAIAAARARDAERRTPDIGQTLVNLSRIWYPHIAQEESYLTLDRVSKVMSPEQHASLSEAISAHSQAHAKPEYLVLPFMLYSLPPADRAVIASHLPPIVVEQLIPLAWAPQWSPMKPFLLD